MLLAATLAVAIVGPVPITAQSISAPVATAGFLFNFAKFTDWPDDAAPPGAPMVLCVDDADVAGALTTMATGRAVGITSPSASATRASGRRRSGRTKWSGRSTPASRGAHHVQPIARRLRLLAAVRNLFDTAYSDPASEEHRQAVIPQDGLTARVGLEGTWTR
jgi:hypothetical protein